MQIAGRFTMLPAVLLPCPGERQGLVATWKTPCGSVGAGTAP